MAMGDIHKGDVGVALQFTVRDQDNNVIDCSSAAPITIRLLKPSGARVDVNATLVTNGKDGKIQYVTTTASDLDQVGQWQAQVFLGLGLNSFHGDIGDFQVLKNL